MEFGEWRFSDLEKVDDLVHPIWEAAVLICLDRQPMRYTDIGVWVAGWSGRPWNGRAHTKAITHLRDEGLITSESTPDRGRLLLYRLTDAGRARLMEIREIIHPGITGRGQSDINGTIGQQTDGTTASMLPTDRQPTGRIVAPWLARRDRQDGDPVDHDHSPRPVIDTSVAHPARRYNYWLGGKDHFAADRKSGDDIARMMPTVRTAALENRAFQRRAVHYLTQVGIRQFLDIGTGIPAPDNTHQVAQAIAPESRVVYVDNDPLVLTHARALLTSTPQGRTAYIDADLREPAKILHHPEVRATLDFDQPIGLLLIAVLHFVTRQYDAYAVVNELLAAMPPGSYLAITHATTDFMSPAQAAQADAAVASGRHGIMQFRTHDQIAQFFTGVELVPPGLVPLGEWQRTDSTPPNPADIGGYGAVAKI